MDRKKQRLRINTLAGCVMILRRARRRRIRTSQVHPVNTLRSTESEFVLFERLLNFPDRFKSYMRMSRGTFFNLLSLLRERLERKDSFREDILTPQQRLILTIRFLATGASFAHLAFSFRVGKTTVHAVVKEVTKAMYAVLRPLYLRCPTEPDEWLSISDEFLRKWNVPNCCGSLDGKHVSMKAPPKSSALHYNYKGGFSSVLMCLSDANYRILYASFGHYGSASDGGIFDRSDLKRALDSGTLNLPAPTPIDDTGKLVPFFFLADAAFPLLYNLMKPYPGDVTTKEQRIYNYRHCRGRRVVENCFGLLSARWRILLKRIETDDKFSDDIVKACCCLHNYLLALEPPPPSWTDNGLDLRKNGEWRNAGELQQARGLRRTRANRARNDAEEVRKHLCDYFSTIGAVPWQERMIS